MPTFDQQRTAAHRVWLVCFIIAILIPTVFSPAAPRAYAEDAAQIITRWPAREKLVALTFDAGSDFGVADEIMDILSDYDVAATFFLTGQWMDINPEAAGRIPSEGHALGNHSYTHPDFTELSVEDMRREIRETEQTAQEIAGETLTPYFRPPYGAYDPEVLRSAAREDYSYSVMWSIDTLDWKGISAEEVLQRVVEQLEPGAVVLMHVGSGTHTIEALPLILDHLADRGYTAVTLDELIASTEPALAYTVKAGDTLFSISEKFDIRPEEIEAENERIDFSTLQIGQMLLIPGDFSGKPEKEDYDTDDRTGEAIEDSAEEKDGDDHTDEIVPAGEEGAGREEIDPEPESQSLWELFRNEVERFWRGIAGLMARLLRWITG